MIKYVVSTCLLIKLSYGLIPPIKPDCAAVACLLPQCTPDQVFHTPKGQCCPKCYKEGDYCGIPNIDCDGIKAPSFLCPDGQTCYGNCGECTFEKNPQTGTLECSPWKPEQRVCSNSIDCSMIQCALPLCKPCEELFTPEGQCCPTCKPKLDCRVVLCLPQECGPGEEPYTHECGCCQKCRPIDCTAVLCPLVKCGVDEELYTPKGKCCPQCRSKPVFCTQDAKECPDGSFVGRDSENNCKFFPCGKDNKKCKKDQCRDGTEQCVDGSIINCKVAPCLINNGGCNDGQLCTDNYCNGCNAICSECPRDTHCVDRFNNCVSGNIWYCFIDPCSLNNGGCNEEQECMSNYCNGCNAICVPKCNDLQCRNSNGICQTKTCKLDPCNNIKDPCPRQLCSADTCSDQVCQAICSPCPKLTHYTDGNNRCVPY
eukprot:234363_1